MSAALIALLFAVGLVLVITELFTPGLVLGVVGCACLAAAIYGTFQYGALAGVAALVVSSGFVAAVLLFGIRRLTLRKVLDAERGYASADPGLQDLLGREGQALTPLYPGGYCRIDGRRVSVVTRGEPVAANAPVRVVDVEGGRVVVKGL